MLHKSHALEINKQLWRGYNFTCFTLIDTQAKYRDIRAIIQSHAIINNCRHFDGDKICTYTSAQPLVQPMYYVRINYQLLLFFISVLLTSQLSTEQKQNIERSDVLPQVVGVVAVSLELKTERESGKWK